MTYLRRAFVAASIAWAMLLPLAPFAASQRAPAPFWYSLAFIVYGAGSFICHQLPARSFHTWSAQWPVCARCTGIYLGSAIVGVIALFDTNTTHRLNRSLTALQARAVLAAAAFPSVVTLIYEWTTGDPPSNTIRVLAGAPLGAAIAFLIVGTLGGRVARPSTSEAP